MQDCRRGVLGSCSGLHKNCKETAQKTAQKINPCYSMDGALSRSFPGWTSISVGKPQ